MSERVSDGRSITLPAFRPCSRGEVHCNRREYGEVGINRLSLRAYCELAPGQIVPSMADRGVYLAPESSYYRVLRSASQQHHLGRASNPSARGDESLCYGSETGLVVGHYLNAGCG